MLYRETNKSDEELELGCQLRLRIDRHNVVGSELSLLKGLPKQPEWFNRGKRKFKASYLCEFDVYIVIRRGKNFMSSRALED